MEERNSNFIRDFLIIILSSIIAITFVIVANNYGLIKLYASDSGSTSQSNEAGESSALSVQEVVQNAIACSVSVYLTDQTKSYFNGAGSGVILKYSMVSNTAFVITNDHVISSSFEGGIQIFYLNRYYEATLIGTDPENDIAVLSFKPLVTPSIAKFGRDISNLKIGEKVVAVGNAAALDYTVTDGLISYIGRSQDYRGIEKTYVQTSAVINPGNSGGGLFDLYGNLIAINTMGLTNYDDINFSLPIMNGSTVDNTNYNRSNRDAITSFNCLIQKYNELVESSSSYKIGYIDGQKYIGARFETLTDTTSGTIKKNAYVASRYNYFDLESGSYEWLAPRYAKTTTLETDYSSVLRDTITKVEYSIDGGSTWRVATVEGATLFGSITLVSYLSGNFTSVDVMNFIAKAPMNTLVRFSIQTISQNLNTGELENVDGIKTTTVKVKQFMFQFAD